MEKGMKFHHFFRWFLVGWSIVSGINVLSIIMKSQDHYGTYGSWKVFYVILNVICILLAFLSIRSLNSPDEHTYTIVQSFLVAYPVLIFVCMGIEFFEFYGGGFALGEACLGMTMGILIIVPISIYYYKRRNDFKTDQRTYEKKEKTNAAKFTNQIMREVDAAGGVYRYIAQNMATIYYIVNHSGETERYTRKQKLYATALIDAYAYIVQGKISMEQVALSVEYCDTPAVVLFGTTRYHGSSGETIEKILNVTMQMAAMVIDADCSLPSASIADAVVAQKGSIKSMIKTTFRQGKNAPLYETLYESVEEMLRDPSFREIVEACRNFKGDSIEIADRTKQMKSIDEMDEMAIKGKCEICGKTGKVYHAHIPDLACGYSLCRECIEKENATID